MSSASPYLFLEIAAIVFFLGFGWEYLRPQELISRRFWLPALFLAGFWLALDQIAIRIGLWSFPAGGTLPVRILNLPLEEYLLFIFHSVICV